MVSPFTFSSPAKLVFGPGKIAELADAATLFGSRILFVTGNTSFKNTRAWDIITDRFSHTKACLFPVSVAKEPSPALVDHIVQTHKEKQIDLVIAAGGGSVIDAGKAISAMMHPAATKKENSVEIFLEGIGTQVHDGKKLPFIAIPTTSGTGSEATKNAVLSNPGPSGYKKSLRHDNLIPNLALVDPELTRSCPSRITAACGMDALTQLLEAFVSVKASPMTRALCRSGLTGFGQALSCVLKEDPEDLEARSRLSYGAYMSGLALANAGLGTVHGFASVIGGLAANRHGEICGTLLAATTNATIEALKKRSAAAPALSHYAEAAILLGVASPADSVARACGKLMDRLFQWTEDFDMPRLAACGITHTDIPAIARATGQKNTPAVLPQEDLVSILEHRL